MENSNAERFLEIYNKIDAFLGTTHRETEISFTEKVNLSSNAIIKAHKDKLKAYGRLRNAIVHNPKTGGHYIANPTDKVVYEFEEIYNTITNPLRVDQVFNSVVFGARQDDDLRPILENMYKHRISQFPVFDQNDHVIELINANSIFRWLSKHINDGQILIENLTIKDLLQEEIIEFQKNYDFIKRTCDLYTAYEIFIEHINKKNRTLDALFITQNGKPTEKLLGLITIEDITHKLYS